MAEKITIEPVSRIEGHGTITITLEDDGSVGDATFHVTQFRGFEKLCDGRPYYEMPSIAERVENWSYLKSPYYKALGYPGGIYRVGPAARLNVCNGCGTPLADQEWAEFRDLERGPVLSSFYNHYARLIEILDRNSLLCRDHGRAARG